MGKATSFKIVISKVSELVYSGEASSVTLPGSEGELTILPGHEPLITILKSGTITVRDGEVHQFVITGGLLETSHGQVTVLV